LFIYYLIYYIFQSSDERSPSPENKAFEGKFPNP